MEPQSQPDPHSQTSEEQSASKTSALYPTKQNGGAGGGNGTRWTPTTDQIRILKDLYYNSGVRSPTNEQIQRISARLRQYGKIEGKNVFYWFQNHKARERQKKRFTAAADMPAATHRSICPNVGVNHALTGWKPEHDFSFPSKYSYPMTASPGLCSSSPSACGVFGGGPSAATFGYGSVHAEQVFMEGYLGGGSGGAVGWVAMDPFNKPSSFGRVARRSMLVDRSCSWTEEGGEESPPEIETLPLFPMKDELDYSSAYSSTHGFDCFVHNSKSDGYCSGDAIHCSEDGNSGDCRATLELSLGGCSSDSI